MQLQFPSHGEIAETLTSSDSPSAHSFAKSFRSKRGADSDDGWAVLEQIFSFHFKPRDVAEPFGPMRVLEGKRTSVPADLADDVLDALGQTLELIEDPEYQARIADVLWLCRRDAGAARTAVGAYLASGMRLEDPQHWVKSMERYERAVRLARQVEPKGDLPKRVLQHLEDRVRHYDANDPLYFALHALELLEEFRFGTFPVLADLASRVADRARAAGDLERARKYLDVASKLYRRVGDLNLASKAKATIVDCFIQEAEAREAGGSFIAARVFWQSAIKAARECPERRARGAELQERLSNAGKRMLDEMQSFSHEVDISEQVTASRKAVGDLPWEDAFYLLICLPEMPSK